MTKKRNPPSLTDEDIALWRHVTGSVRPYRGQKKKPAEAKTPARKTVETPLPAPPPRGVKPARDGATEEKLRRGKLPVEATIDLHGMTQDKAHAALLRFISSAERQGKRTLLVITGKGARTSGGGVLRRMLPLWLEEPSLAHRILAVRAARAEHGGDGAFYVRLRK